MKCWGSNAFGKLGDGTTTNHNVATGASGLSSGVLAVAAGFDHTCALTTGGNVKCWGSNANGQLGDGSGLDQHSPVDVMNGAVPLAGVVAITSAQTHTCALMAAGGVKCWGHNNAGQIGDNTTTDRPTPKDVVGLSGISAIAAAGSYSCALTDAGGVKCWGLNDVGQLGDGTIVERHTPVATSGLGSGVSRLAAGGGHACALMVNGGVKCWGYNGSGQLGNASTTNSTSPVDVTGLSNIAIIATGGDHTCAMIRSGSVTNSGQVTCWGRNINGQLGDTTTTNRSTATLFVDGLNLTH